jgi:quinohemoprotein ethanol dehydrogenase
MRRWPYTDSARRFFLEVFSPRLNRPRMTQAGIALGLGLAISAGAAMAERIEKGSADHIKATTSAVDANFIKANTPTSKDWPTIGLDYAESRFSKLNQINASNVKDLGLKWTYSLESIRGVEATPLVVDGIMYVSASWSVVHAIDARTGKRIWTYDPGVNREIGYKGCCDVVNRGVALYKGKIYVGAYDGRLIAIDAVTGKKIWEKDTVIDRSHSYTITGAPRIVKGKVLIGNGGAEYGARGYITAYDAESGAQAWRWFVVPGDPAKPFEDESMAKAAQTWDPAANGGSMAAAAHHGIPSPTIPI